MKNWRVERNGLFLGHFIADDLRLDDGTLYAYRSDKRIGSVAGGVGLSWTAVGFDDAAKGEEVGNERPTRG